MLFHNFHTATIPHQAYDRNWKTCSWRFFRSLAGRRSPVVGFAADIFLSVTGLDCRHLVARRTSRRLAKQKEVSPHFYYIPFYYIPHFIW
jgi:uncharacterized protein (DUF2062 family)